MLKRPSYKLVLVVNKGNLEDVADEGGCILPEHEFKAVLKQELSGEPELYEVGGPGWIGAIANIFADTNLTVTLDDGGHLVSVEAGAADKSLEFVQAVAGLVVSLGKKAAGPVSPGFLPAEARNCFINDKAQKKSIKGYAQRHLTLHQRSKTLRDALKKSFVELRDAAEPTRREEILEVIALLRTEQTRVQAALREIGYAVPSTLYCLSFDGNRIDPKSGLAVVDECEAEFTIKLRRHT